MPIMHRLACLRDDVIFLIFCYQRYKYRTDYSRVNEYGQCEQPTEDMINEKDTIKIDADGPKDGDQRGHNSIRKPRRGARDKKTD